MQLSSDPTEVLSCDAPLKNASLHETPTEGASMKQETPLTDSEEYGLSEEASEQGRRMAQYIRDVYDSGAKLWTKDMFRDAEREMAKDPRPASIQLRSMNGVIKSVRLPKEGHTREGFDGVFYINATFELYQSMLESAERGYWSSIDEESEVYQKTEATRAFSINNLGSNKPPMVEYDKLMEVWDKTRVLWMQSSARARLATVFYEAPITKTVERVIGFGLGTLEYCAETEKDGGDILSGFGSICQHLAAIDVASTLGSRLGANKTLPVMVQDPGYSDTSKRLLAAKGVDVIGGFGSLGFTFVDENSVVFSISPNIPVKQVVADIAKPAAMVWNRVTDASEDTTESRIEIFNGQETRVMPFTTDNDSPRTRKLVEEYNKYDFTSGTSCERGVFIYVRRDA